APANFILGRTCGDAMLVMPLAKKSCTKMKSSIPRPALEKPSTLLPFVVIALTLSIFAVAIWLVSQDLRAKIREQIAGRDGEILHQIARLQQSIDAAQAEEEDSTDQVTFLLKISRLPQLKDTM